MTNRLKFKGKEQQNRWLTPPNITIHRTFGKLRLPSSADFNVGHLQHYD